MALDRAEANEYDDGCKYALCAIIVRGGAVLSVGFNRSPTNGFVEHYADRVLGPDRDFTISTHAEVHAIQQVRAKVDLVGCKVYVARRRWNNTVGLARPCEICQETLSAYGIKKAIYTISEMEYGVLKL